ncbi:MAG: OmpH family outer membrane protein [Candidatus Eiseniibacteriota bacterium]
MGVPLPDRRGLVLALIAAGPLALSPGDACAEGIGVVDFQLIFERYEGYEDAQRTFEREYAEWEDQAKDMRSAIDQLQQEIESQRLMLSEERLREKEDELRRLREEYENFAQDIWSVTGKAAKRNAELTRPLSEKIREVVARLGEEKGLDLVLDAGTGGVVWAKDDVNLTQLVLDDLALTVEGRTPTPPANTGEGEGEREGEQE